MWVYAMLGVDVLLILVALAINPHRNTPVSLALATMPNGTDQTASGALNGSKSIYTLTLQQGLDE